MTNNKKLIVIIASLVAIVLASITTLIIVLVSSNQQARSNVTVKYTATDVACDLSATYALKNATEKTFMTVGGSEDGDKMISFNEEVANNGVLKPLKDIELSKEQPFVVFEYRFTNPSSDIPITVKLTESPSVVKNTTLSYLVTNTEVLVADYATANFSNEDILNVSYTAANNQTKYIYIKAQVANLLHDAEFSGDFSWDLSRASAGVIASTDKTTTNNNKVLSVTGAYAGNVVDATSLNNTTSDVNVLGWYEDEDCTQKANFPLTANEDTVLYAEYLEANVPQDNIVYDPNSDSYVVNNTKLVTTTASTTSAKIGYTPLTSTDTNTVFVIPDRYNGPNGVKAVTAISDGSITSNLLVDNSNITKVYIGNNINKIGSYFAYNSVIEQLSLPKSVTNIGEKAFYNCTYLNTIEFNAENCADLASNDTFYNAGASSSSLTLNVEEGVSRIPANMFDVSNVEYFAKISTVNFAETTTSLIIKDYAFSTCLNLTTLNIPNNVTSIGYCAFMDCTGLANLTIGSGLTEIGDFAFYRCGGLSTIVVNGNNTVFDSRNDCNAIINTNTNALVVGSSNTIIPNTVVTIASNAFRQNTNLTSITIPEGVKTIEGNAFRDCSGLTSLTIPASVKEIGSIAFAGCGGLNTITVTSGNTVYDSRDNCNAIIETKSNTLLTGCNNTVIPSTVTVIGPSAFRACKGLTTITIPSGITKIEAAAFAFCENVSVINYNATTCEDLTSSTSNLFVDVGLKTDTLTLNIGENVKVIPAYMYNKMPLTSVNFLGNSECTSINANAFYNCVKLQSVTIPNNIKNIASHSFYSCVINQLNYNATSATDQTSSTGKAFEGATINKLNIGANVTKIPAYMFRSSNAKSLVFENNSVCTSIGAYAFNTCDELTDITLPNSLLSIGNFAFNKCSLLNELVTPNSLQTIGNSAFRECTNLTTITISENVTSIGSAAFAYASNLIEINYNAIMCEDHVSGTSNTFTGVGATSGSITLNIGAKVAKIPAYFFNSLSLTSVNFETDAVCSVIGQYAFRGCTTLTTFNVPACIKTIGRYAFQSCTNLANVSFTDTANWYYSSSTVSDDASANYTALSASDIANASTVLTYIKTTYLGYYWHNKTA